MAMAMTVPSTSHASSYHVFLSFRGTDTRQGFTGNLYKALTHKGIYTFIDDEELQKGEEITPSLVKAIQGSKIAIIVLSEDYAASSFCLDELIIAVNTGLLVIPVFYKVDPSDVRHLRGTYEKAMTKHEKRYPEKLHKWKEALHKVADFSGYHLKEGDGYEHNFIGSIVDWVSEKINHPARLRVESYLVGLESSLEQVMMLLDVGSNDVVHMVGIHGMGGVGKSTLASAVYDNLIAHNFDSFCYLENIREESEKHSLKHLQSILLKKILGDEKINVTSVGEGASIIKQRLQLKKILLVLDDVDKIEQLEAIVGRPEWYGLGSRVIITTRDQQLLACHQVKRIYQLKTLNEDDARQFLTRIAFKKEKADPSHEDVLNRALTYSSGLPLALKVIGSHLFGKSIEAWESSIDQYKRKPVNKIQNILKVSFDTLEEEEKSVFLDIACIFKGHKLKEIEGLLSVLYDGSLKHHIDVLVDKSLINVKSSVWNLGGDTVEMHDLIQEMGRQIDKESPKKPQKRKRLWLWKDIIEVLKHNTGTDKIEIIYLDVPMSSREETVEWDGNGFKEMKNLKILVIKNVKFSEGPKCLPNSLRVLEWRGYPSNCLPSDFQPQNLVKCKLPKSCFTSFELDHSSKMLKNLTVLKFDWCYSLTQIGDLSGLNNLEKLSFKYCYYLVRVHESVGRLGKVKKISAYRCEKLVSFPPIHSTSLEYLDLSKTGLESSPEISEKMENKKELHLSCTSREESPISYINLMLKNLTVLKFNWCDSLTQIGDLSCLNNLEELSFGSCSNLDTVHESVGRLGKVKRINARKCENLVSFPPIHLTSLEELDLSGTGLKSFPEILGKMENIKKLHLKESLIEEFPISFMNLMCQNVTVLNFDYCTNLTQIPDLSNFSNLEVLSFRRCLNLVTVYESVGRLGKVKRIDAWGCKKLVSFPPIHLTSLEQLDLSKTGLESFPEILGTMENIKELTCYYTPIKELPNSFVNLVRLQKLDLSDCGSVVKLPISILMMPELTHFIAYGCKGMKWVKEEDNEETMDSIVSLNLNSLTLSRCNLGDDFFSIMNFTRFAHVTELRLSGNSFTFLPECIKEFQSLRDLDVSDCKHLQEIRGVPPKIQYFDARVCKSLSSSSISMFMNQELYEASMTVCRLPGARIPEWFEHKSRGSSTSFWFRNKLPAKILCLLIRPPLYMLSCTLFINDNKVLGFHSPFKYLFRKMDHTIIFELDLKRYLCEVTLRKEWNHVQIIYTGTSVMKATGIHAFKEKSREKDIRFSDPCRKTKLDD